MTQIAMSGVGVSFGATRLLDDVTFTVGAGDKWGVVGRNGSGKTTLFRLITGVMEPTRGQVTRVGGLRISLLEQHRDFGDATTVWEAAAGPFAELLELERSLAEQATALAVVHAELILIHPFRDGNGRCARLVAMLMGLQAGLPALDFGGIRGEKKRQYISAVQAALSRDYAPMIEVFRGVIGTTLKSVARTSF